MTLVLGYLCAYTDADADATERYRLEKSGRASM
jgi:hypothetical protein